MQKEKLGKGFQTGDPCPPPPCEVNSIIMPEYLSILREASVPQFIFLFVFVLILFLLKGKIQLKEFLILFYIWLPLGCSNSISNDLF